MIIIKRLLNYFVLNYLLLLLKEINISRKTEFFSVDICSAISSVVLKLFLKAVLKKINVIYLSLAKFSRVCRHEASALCQIHT